MRTIGKTLAGICAILFVISGVTAIMFFNIERKAFSSETYKTAFKEQGLYNDAPAIFTDILLTSATDPGQMSGLLSVLNRDELELVISSLLPPEQLEALIGDTFDSFFDYLNGEVESITVNLVSIKQSLAGEGGVNAFTQIMLAQPDCTLEQAFSMAMGGFSMENGLVLCKPPQEVIAMVTPLIQSQLQIMASNFPDEMTLAGDRQTGLSDFRSRLDKVRAVMQLTTAIPLILLFAITAFAVRSLTEWLSWWGWPFIITGALSTLFAIAGTPVVRLFMESVILQGNADMPPVFLYMMRGVVSSLTRLILSPIAFEGILLAAIGTGMVIGARFIKRQLH